MPDIRKHICIIALLIIAIMVSSVLVQAQDESNITFITVRGSISAINCFMQDTHGQVWVGSQDGMLISDGVNLARHSGNINNQLGHEIVNCIYSAGNNVYYLGTSNGLYKMNLENDSYNLLYETSAINIQHIFRQDADNILLGTDNGLFNLCLSTEEVIPVDGFDESSVKGIVKVNSLIAVANAHGITFIDQHRHRVGVLNSTESPTTLFYDFIGRKLLVGTPHGLVSYDMSLDRPSPTDVLKVRDVTSIYVDSKEDVWIGTSNGLYYKENSKDIFIPLQQNPIDRYSLISNAITSLYEDQGTNIWVGTKHGVSLYHRGKPIVSHVLKDVNGSALGITPTTMLRDREGRLWVGTHEGLYMRDRNIDTMPMQKMAPNRLKDTHIRDIVQDGRGSIWICTDTGICRYLDGGDVTALYSLVDTAGVRSSALYSIVQTDTDRYAIGSIDMGVYFVDVNGLYNPRDNTIKAYDRIESRETSHISPDMRMPKLVRCGTDAVMSMSGSNSVMRVSPEGVGYFQLSPIAGHNAASRINAIYIDKDSMMWLGGIGQIDYIDPHNFEVHRLNDKNIELRNTIGIAEHGGNLWLIFADGLGVYNKDRDQFEIIANFNEPLGCAHYSEENGLLYIGFPGKYCVIDLDKALRFSVYENMVYFTSLTVNNQHINVGTELSGNQILSSVMPFVDKLTLNHDQNNLMLSFVDGIHHPVLAAHYRYRLYGASDEWIELPPDQKSITLSGIPPGKYQLQLQRTNLFEEVGNDLTQASIDIDILHPWYSSTIARTIYAILGLLMIYSVINYYRVRNSLRLSEIERTKTLELSGMKTEFLTNMSHEIKTPLTFILENVNILLNSVKNPTQRSNIKALHANTMQISRIVHEMLNVQDDVPDGSIRNLRTELTEFIGCIIDTYRESAVQRGIDFKTDIKAEEITVLVDPMKLEVAVGNLLSNALKFTPDSGSIEVRLTCDDTKAYITVEDSGIGIAAKDIPLIFNRFFQGSNGAGNNKNGSGIGLATTKKYVESMDGSVLVESETGKGSRFTIVLPLCEPETENEVAQVQSDDEDGAVSAITILIVEDNDEICRMLQRALTPYNCVIAHNGKSGLEKALEIQPQLIISDIMMPVMDGIQMLKKLRRNVNLSSTPVIMLTAKDNQQTHQEAVALGVDLFLSKPFDTHILKGYVKRIIASNNAQSAKPDAPAVEVDVHVSQQEISDQKFLEEINTVIQDNLNDSEFGIEKLSKITGYSGRQLYRRIKVLTGETAVGYIQSVRLKKAALLLQLRHYTVSEVMYMVGFTNASYFSKCFTAKYGMTPSAYTEQ